MYKVTNQSDRRQRTMTASELKKMLRPNQLEPIEIAIECSGYYEDDQFRVEPCITQPTDKSLADKLALILRTERDRIHGLTTLATLEKLSMYAAVTSIEYSIRDMYAADDSRFDRKRFRDIARASRSVTE